MFNVSQLKVLAGNVHTSQHLSTVITDVLTRTPDKILASKMVKRQNRTAIQVLVKWVNQGEKEVTSEFLIFNFTSLQLSNFVVKFVFGGENLLIINGWTRVVKAVKDVSTC